MEASELGDLDQRDATDEFQRGLVIFGRLAVEKELAGADFLVLLADAWLVGLGLRFK